MAIPAGWELAKAPTTQEILAGCYVYPADRSKAWFAADNYYPLYWKLAHALRPERVLEIGVRFGYSAVALCRGAGRIRRYRGLDNESYVAGCLEQARTNLARAGIADTRSRCLLRVDTRREDATLHVEPCTWDLVHVDGDHSYEGCLKDLRLVWPHVRDGGVVVADDYRANSGGVYQACQDFHREVRASLVEVPSFTGWAVFVKE